jgi:teichoic acid transport system permease protein
MRKNELKMAYFLAVNSLKRENRGTSLGYMWLIINPLITAFTFGLVWGIFMPGTNDGFAQLPWLLAGFFPWFLVSESFTKGAFSIIDNKNLVTKIVFPLHLLPIIEIVKALLKFAILIVFLIIVLAAYNIYPTWNWLWIIYDLIAVIFFVYSLTRVFAVIVTFYRDFGNLINSIMQLLLWASGVLLPISKVDNEVIKTIIMLNPFAYIVNIFRFTFLNMPDRFISSDPSVYMYTIAFWMISLIIFVTGNYLFETKKKDFGDAL